jgi:pyruvate/2-oxoglutarate dehydrogenase complex dihydrolipoamide dehydrogenase (E3) component
VDDGNGYDAIVLGLGTAGGSVLWPLHQAGMKVAAVERELVGGVCAYWGCIASKTLLRPGTIGWEAYHGFGVSEPGLIWSEIAQYRNHMVRDWDDHAQVEELVKAGIDFVRGEATIQGPGTVRVNEQTLRTRRIVIATGSAPTIPLIEGLEQIGYWTNREATSFQDVPESVLVLGGGSEGAELAQVLHGYGAEVTIVEEADQLLGHEDPEAARHLEERFKSIGITLYLGRKAIRFEEADGQKTATLDNGHTLSVHEVLVSTSRHPNTAHLGLERIGIKTTKKGLQIDEHCRAGENVWAVGDVTGMAGFTHVADYQGHIATQDILGIPRPANYSAIPTVTYTDPEVASVGITGKGTAPQDMDLISAHVPLNGSSRADTYGHGYQGGLKLFADCNDGVLIGAWAVGPLAGEWIQVATLAIRARVPVDVLEDTIFAFPTFTRLYLQPIRELQRTLGKPG